ncbi:MAG: iron chelate uptake ABC transporter family permease subunit [Acidobacteria bacterium]|nr:iron chelate uptake ABC transporter family permease subunit [Acidobacteriota bacterium]
MDNGQTPAITSPPAGEKKLTRFRRQIVSLLILAPVLLVVMAAAACLGSVNVPFGHTIGIIVSKLLFFLDFSNSSWTEPQSVIIFDVRLPRIVMAALCGAALSIAGATYQGLFRNPLADPYLIGVSQGAAFGAVLAIFLSVGWTAFSVWMIPVFAFSGALLATFLVYRISRTGNILPTTTLILAGIALGAFFAAGASYIMSISSTKIGSMVLWLMGSFNNVMWNEVRVTFPAVLAGLFILILFGRSLNIMQLGDDQAKQLGLNVERDKKILLAVSTIVVAAAVSFVGIIGFVGIIIPHAVRLIWGPDYRFLLPLSVLLGAVFMVTTDIVARVLFAPAEIPIGVITAACGAPFFLYLLRKKMKSIF